MVCQAMTDKELGTVFRLIDTDGSGDVDADEFAIWLGHRTSSIEPHLYDSNIYLHLTCCLYLRLWIGKSLQQRQQERQDKIDELRARQDAKIVADTDTLFDRATNEVRTQQQQQQQQNFSPRPRLVILLLSLLFLFTLLFGSVLASPGTNASSLH